MREIISTDDAPPVAGAYSQGTTDGSLVFTAGQVALTPDGTSLANESISSQTTQVLENIEAILHQAGTNMEKVMKTTVFLANIDDFEEMNEAYEAFFPEYPPARTAVQAGALPLDFDVEIEAIATIP